VLPDALAPAPPPLDALAPEPPPDALAPELPPDELAPDPLPLPPASARPTASGPMANAIVSSRENVPLVVFIEILLTELRTTAQSGSNGDATCGNK
jgi:hypothetical protein